MLRGYLIGRVHPSCHDHNDEIAELAEGPNLIKYVFQPHWYAPNDIPHEQFPKEVADEDIDQMERADIGIVALPIGVDCGSEIGWFAGKGKPVVAIIHNWSDPVTNRHAPSRKAQWESLQRHWMVKTFLTKVIIVGDELTVDKADPILFDKTVYIENEHDVYDHLELFVTAWKIEQPWYPTIATVV